MTARGVFKYSAGSWQCVDCGSAGPDSEEPFHEPGCPALLLAPAADKQPGARYKPASAAEREAFFRMWCQRCARDASMNSGKRFEDCRPHEICPLIGATDRLEATDPAYPREWRYDRTSRPSCAAFIPVGQPAPVLGRCPYTRELL